MIFKDLKFSAKVHACREYFEGLDDDDIDLDEAYQILIQNDEDQYDILGNYLEDSDEWKLYVELTQRIVKYLKNVGIIFMDTIVLIVQ